jgi:hypothetical protein
MKPILSGEAVYLPVGSAEAKEAMRTLKVRVYSPGEEDPRTVHAWVRRDGYVAIPRQYGMAYVGLDHDTSLPSYYEIGHHRLPDLWDYQTPWVDDLVDKALLLGDVVAMAATGKGKTVMSLYAACRLGLTTLIVVDQEFLRDQWIDTLKTLYSVHEDDIGLIQGPVCDVEGKSFVIGMIQTLYNRPRDLFLESYFGTVIYDECHTVGAPQFSKVLFMFNAAHRIAVSATPKRGDALDKILQWHLGPVRVVLEDKHDPSKVRYLESDGIYSWYANISPKVGRFVNEIVEDGKRNALLADAILWLYESGRDVLAVSDRIEHLENLMAYCAYMGIPEEDMGVVSGYYHVWGYAKDPNPKRKPEHWEKGTEYTPVSLQLIRKRTPRNTLAEIKATRKVIFATYGMFTKGVDVPRLSGGIDCTPRSKARQVHGRILRKKEGKLTPIWVTVRDVNSFRSQYMFGQRISEYTKSNAEVYKWVLGKGVKRVDPAEIRADALRQAESLKQRKISVGRDGSNIMQTQNTGSVSKRTLASPTVRTTRSAKAN